uniref:Uncharacterized protein n=1 Tax=Tanacetum cinerariifolium TaxID=118510 RepID=A0A6L2MXX2_TANCI|nr:hypothetical protein [Tanacetum cinerariifolium]
MLVIFSTVVVDDPYDSSARIPGRIVIEAYTNTTPENQKLINAKVEAVHMIPNGIGNDIYSTVDAFPNAKEIHTGQFRNQRAVIVAGKWKAIGNQAKGIPLNAEQSEWLQGTYDELDEQELKAHYMYMKKIQEVLHATNDNSGPTFDTEPLEKVHLDDDYAVFATKRQHPEQPKSINDTYVMEKVDSNVTPNSSYMSNNK